MSSRINRALVDYCGLPLGRTDVADDDGLEGAGIYRSTNSLATTSSTYPKSRRCGGLGTLGLGV